MLELRNIKKVYEVGDEKVTALNDVSLTLRDSEFVSVLGPSGCGKTTLLNIIGGLDHYDSGDLLINSVSTKRYKDRDWDSYRNHSVGFVFQSYNLIPHQNVLSNVELALTLTGVSKKERRARAKEVLKKVGLENQMHKKPNQMSGGQMQRVAIARALINNPDILLADEPTGALDTETSTQIMELLKEISKDRLIVMVTHNPDLANTYSTRIINLLDGKITNDSNPYDKKTEEEVPKKKIKKPSMGLFTAFSLSLNNLMTKKARTFLTAFAGSIGIIGIALILALSTGIQEYIDSVEADTMSSYPITIESENVDINAILEKMMGGRRASEEKADHDLDKVYANTVMSELITSMNNLESKHNNLEAFKEFLDSSDEMKENVSAILYSYGFDFNVLTEDSDGTVIKSDIDTLMSDALGTDNYAFAAKNKDNKSDASASMSSFYSGMLSSFSNLKVWSEMLPDKDGNGINDIVYDQYELVYGNWPSEYNDVLLVLDKNNEITDMSLYALGLKPYEEMKSVMQATMNEEEIENSDESWTYDEIMAKTFKLIPSSDYYNYDSQKGIYKDISTTDAGLSYLYDNGIDLNVSGVIRLKEDVGRSGVINGSMAYTHELTKYVIDRILNSDVVKAQLESPDIDVLKNLPFATDENTNLSDEEKITAFRDYAEGLDEEKKAELYVKVASYPDEDYVKEVVDAQMENLTRQKIEDDMTAAYAEEIGMDEDKLRDYISGLSDDELMDYARQAIEEQVYAAYAQRMAMSLAYMSPSALAYSLDAQLPNYTDAQLVSYYDNFMPEQVSESTLDENLETLGYVDINVPTMISIYANSFESKDNISDIIEGYNESVSEDDEISYTDYVGLLMSSVSTVINGISYVLVAFVGVSLIVSSIMIGIITYISVLERTKEIGVLRSIGASKMDVSRVFNAETIIVGLIAGILGIVISLILEIPINIIVENLTSIPNVSHLPFIAALILIGISILLTFIAGLFPARVAAKKDPVEALRTE